MPQSIKACGVRPLSFAGRQHVSDTWNIWKPQGYYLLLKVFYEMSWKLKGEAVLIRGNWGQAEEMKQELLKICACVCVCACACTCARVCELSRGLLFASSVLCRALINVEQT